MYEGKAVQGSKQGESERLSQHRDTVNRYGRAHLRADAMGQFLTLRVGQATKAERSTVAHLSHRASKLAGCGSFLTFRDYFTVGETRLTSATFCQQDRLCPLCAIRRGGRFLRAYSDRIAALRLQTPSLRFSLLTITVRDGEDLAERFGHLDSAWLRLLQRRRNALKGRTSSAMAQILGGVSSIEIKRGANSGLWHPHLHAVVASQDVLGDGKPDASGWWKWPDLSREWHDLTGDSHVVDVRPIHNPDEPGRDLVEVFKYALKFADLDLADNLAAFLILHGKHLVRPFGNFWGVQVPADLRDEPLSPDLPYIELLYRYAGQGAYRPVASHTRSR